MFQVRFVTASWIAAFCVMAGWFGLNIPSASATRIQWCMRVVPSGELVIRYGENWCKR